MLPHASSFNTSTARATTSASSQRTRSKEVWYPYLRIENGDLDAMPVHERLHEVHAEFELPAKHVVAFGRPQHAMAGIHTDIPVLSIDAKAFGEIECRIVGDRGGAYPVGQSRCSQHRRTWRVSFATVSEHFKGLSQRV